VTTTAVDTLVFDFEHLKKSYGPVEALTDGSLRAKPGRCHAVVGDNGAGKSTFLKVVSGAEVADGGTIRDSEGLVVTVTSPQAAISLGIATVYQNLALAENRSVAENVFLGQEPTRFGIISRATMRTRSQEALATLTSHPIPVDTLVANLSGGQRQAVAIARALVESEKKLILLDEPTAALGIQESRHVLETVMALKDTGMSTIMISHSLAHVFHLADDITVFRRGRVVGYRVASETTPEEIVSLITGVSSDGDPE
jgi:ABC-type sugar transport system ATPase subunit